MNKKISRNKNLFDTGHILDIVRRIFTVSVLLLLSLSALATPVLAESLDSALLNSSGKGATDEVIRFLAKGANINARDFNGTTPLIHASLRGNLELVKILLSKGADIDLIDKLGETALSAAIVKNHKSVVEFLIKKGANVNFIPHRSDGYVYHYGPALVVAVKNNQMELTKLLLSKGADVNIRKEGRKYGSTPLGEAAFYGFARLIEVLLKNKADVDAMQWDGVTPLMLAVKRGFIESVDLLVKAGANVNLTDEKGNTPLIMAAEEGHREVVKLLVARKVKLNAEGEFGKTALTIAATKGNAEVVRLLLRAGANPNFQMGARSGIGGTALHVAAKNGQRDAAVLLLKYKADINARDRDGATPLIRAADSYYEEDEDGILKVAELLISKRADINAVNKLGLTALIYASMRGFEKMAELLIDKGADIKIKDSYKSSAINYASNGCNANITAKLIHASAHIDTRLYTSLLMYAAERCYDLKILEVLIEAKADINAQDGSGKTPLDFANSAGRDNNADFLRSRGGRIGKPTGKGIEIVYPSPGDSFIEGDTVKLIVKVSPGTPKLLSVGLNEDLSGTGSHCRREFFGDRYVCKYVIPVDSRPWLTIRVIGTTVDRDIVYHHVPIAVRMPPGLLLRQLNVSTDNSDGKVYLFRMKAYSQLHVQGVYSDGIKRDITRFTTYVTSDPLIARVDYEGRVSPVASGNTIISVRNSGEEIKVPVIVDIKPHRSQETKYRVPHKSKKMR